MVGFAQRIESIGKALRKREKRERVYIGKRRKKKSKRKGQEEAMRELSQHTARVKRLNFL